MAIMHMRMLGTIDSESIIKRTENGDFSWCSFVILVKERNQRVPFTVYSSEGQLIESVKHDLLKGNAVLVSGIIDIAFQNSQQASCPIITSNMVVITDDIRIMYRKKDMEYVATSKTITPLVAPDQSNAFLQFDPNIELPF